MKKLNIFKVLFAATALAIALVGCGDLGEESPAQTQVTKDGKVGVSLSVKEDFRTLVSDVDTANLSYELVISDTADSNAEDYEAARVISLDSLDSSATVAYLTAGKNYSFALTGYKTIEGEKTPIIASRNAVKKTISADDAKVSIMLVALSGSKVNVSLTVSYASSYGVSDLAASVFTDGALTNVASDSLSLDSENEENSDKSDGKVVFTGEIETGSTRWVKIELKDGERTIGGKTLAIYGIPTGDISGQVEASVKEYKASIKLTADTKPESLLLKNKEISKSDYTGISLTTESAEKPYIFTGYVPVGEYDVYNGETVIGQVTNTTALEVNTSVSLTGLSATWTKSQPTFFAGSEGNDEEIKNALTVKATMSNGEEVISNYTIDYDKESTAEQELLVSYTYNGVRKTATVSLKLTEVVLESIAVKTGPKKVNYTEGEKLDLSGLVLNLVYNDVRKNAEVEYVKPDTESGESGNAEDFNIALYSDSECTTEVSEAFTELAATTYYVKVTYAELSAEAFSVKISSGSTYILKAKTAAISLMKSEFGTIADTAQNGGKAYLTAATDNWNSSTTYTYSDDNISYTGVAYNMSGVARTVTLKVKGVSAFIIYARGADTRQYTVTVADKFLGTQKLTSGNVEKSPLFYTDDTGEVSIKLAGVSGSVYPVCITVYSEAGVLNLVKAEFATLKSTVAEIAEADYWTGYDAIVTARDVNTADYTVAQYKEAISALQSAIKTAVKYVAPTAISVTYADVPVENAAELSFSKVSGDTLTLTAHENEGSTGSLTWTVSGIEGVAKEVTVADGVSTCVISGITATGTINVKVEDSRAELSKVFTVTVTAEETKVAADDVIEVTVSATSAIMNETLELTANMEKSYSEAVTYQWYKNGKRIENATTPTLSYTTTDDDAGSLVFTFKVTGAEETASGSASAVTVKNLYKFDFENDTNTSYAIDANIFSTSTKLFTLVAKAKLVNIETDKSPATAEDSSGYIFTKAAVGGDSKSYLSLTAAHNGKVTIYFTSTDSSFASKDQAKSAKIQIDGKDVTLSTTENLSNKTAYVHSWNVEIGSTYKIDNNGSNRLALFGVTFEPEEPTNTTVEVSHDIPTDDISLSVTGSTVSVTLPSGVSESASYEWLVDGYKQPDQSSASFTLSKVYYRNGDSDEEQTILPGQTFIVTARVTIGGLVYTKTTSLLYTGN